MPLDLESGEKLPPHTLITVDALRRGNSARRDNLGEFSKQIGDELCLNKQLVATLGCEPLGGGRIRLLKLGTRRSCFSHGPPREPN